MIEVPDERDHFAPEDFARGLSGHGLATQTPPSDAIVSIYNSVKGGGSCSPGRKVTSCPNKRSWQPKPGPRFILEATIRSSNGSDQAAIELRDAELAKPRVSRRPTEGWRGRSYSFKADEVLAWRGRLLAAAIQEFDANSDITEVTIYPFKLQYTGDGKRREFTPDFLILRNASPWLIFCRWESFIGPFEKSGRLAAIASAVTDAGLGFEVWTERNLYREPARTNVTAINRARQYFRTDDRLQAEITAIARGKSMSAIEIAHHLGCDSHAVLILVLQGVLRVDLEADLVCAPVSVVGHAI